MQYKEERFYTTEMTGQELTKKTNSKIGMLKLTIDDLPRTVERNQLKELKKIATFTENKLEQIQDLKWQVQEAYLRLRVELKKSVNEGGGDGAAPTKTKAWRIHSRERRTGSNDRKTQNYWRGDIKNGRYRAGGGQATKKNSRRTEDCRSQSKNWEQTSKGKPEKKKEQMWNQRLKWSCQSLESQRSRETIKTECAFGVNSKQR